MFTPPVKRSLGLAIVVVCVALWGPAAQAVQYILTDLGTLGGGTCDPRAVNIHGQAVGWSYPPGSSEQHAFLASGGNIQDLGTLGGRGSQAHAINASGQIAGWSYPDGIGYAHAFLYDGMTMRDLGTLGGPYSWAWGINGSGQVVGGAYTTSGQTAFIYENGAMRSLGEGMSGAYDINDSSQVTGYTVTSSGISHAFIYSNGVMQDIGCLGGSAYGQSISETGHVAGYSHLTGSTGVHHAFIYADGVMKDLGTLGGSQSQANSVNSSGQVVGWAHAVRDALKPFLYENGVMVDLNTLLPAGSGWKLWEATGINDKGQIVGSGWNAAHEQHGFLLTPIPEPATLVLVGVGVCLLLRRSACKPG